ncbi:MAG: DDE-type integrase/transposase/recombinase [Spirochaetes bacterium]|jgi:transposase InsO family protein|nr:DDE-type integrase/transposase/recombinase [Spirochaetota bacterium]
MLTSLHKQATATPRIRAALQASDEPAWVLADRYAISEQTVWKWRGQDSVHDRSQTPHRLRTMLLLPRDDLLSVVRAFLNQQVSRSGLDRCLRRHGVSQLQNLKPKAPKTAPEPFKAYAPGYLHVDVKYLPQMAREKRRVRAGCAAGSAASVRAHLVVAVDHATRWVSVRIFPAKTAANARRFLHDLERAPPMTITRVLAANGKELSDRLSGLRMRAATGNHDFDRLRAELGTEHRLAPPMRPETNGMVERFNGRIEDVLQSHRFPSGEELAQTVLRYVHPYNSQFPQSVLKGQTPIDALRDWYRQKPELFKKRPHNHTGSDTCAQSAPPVLLSLPSERP